MAGMLMAGMDVSGDSITGNHKFMAIVITTSESANSLSRSLPNILHMNQIQNKKNRDEITSKLRFDGRNTIAFCVRIDRDTIIKKVRGRKLTRQNISHAKMIRTYHRLLLKCLRQKVEDFIVRHSCSLGEVTFQCDGDCVSFAKDNGLCFSHGGTIHGLADVVAWTNNHNDELPGVFSIDLTREMERQLAACFK